MILPAFVFELQNACSNYNGFDNPLVLLLRFIQSALLHERPPFLPVVESVGFSLLVAFLKEPKIIFFPSESFSLLDKRRKARPHGREPPPALSSLQ